MSIVDDSYSAVKYYKYNEYGKISTLGNTTFINDETYTGAVAEGGNLYYMNARFYNANTGRFLTQDTYRGNAYEPISQNLYTYVGNNPINMVDPTGHDGLFVNPFQGVKLVDSGLTEKVAKKIAEKVSDLYNKWIDAFTDDYTMDVVEFDESINEESAGEIISNLAPRESSSVFTIISTGNEAIQKISIADMAKANDKANVAMVKAYMAAYGVDATEAAQNVPLLPVLATADGNEETKMQRYMEDIAASIDWGQDNTQWTSGVLQAGLEMMGVDTVMETAPIVVEFYGLAGGVVGTCAEFVSKGLFVDGLVSEDPAKNYIWIFDW